MKQLFYHILFSAILIMAFPFDSSGANKDVDFNFPQDVSRDALSDLNKALKSGDGQQTVDALIRYSIAQSGISQDNMADIVEKIESVIKKEKRPEYKALLYYFEAMVYQSYRDEYARWAKRNNPEGEEPTDVSEWDRHQFDVKIAELLHKSLEDPEALSRVPVTSLPDIIKCNKLGATYVPTLQEFMLMKNIDVFRDMIGYEPACQMLMDRWQLSTEGNVPAHIYAMTQSGKSISLDDYNKYSDNEYSALLLDQVSFSDDKEGYKVYKDYVQRFPTSCLTPGIKNRITDLESRAVYVRYPSYSTSGENIPISFDAKNINSFNINVYRIPDGLIGEYRIKVSQLDLVRQHPETVQGTIPFEKNRIKDTLPPLPYGAYILCSDDLSADGKSGKTLDLYSHSILYVSDIAPIVITRIDNKNHFGAVDVNSGKPVSGATINYKTYNNHSGTAGTTGANGLVTAPERYNTNSKGEGGQELEGATVYAVKGEDKYGQGAAYHRMRQYYASDIRGQIYTDLGVYRPGETIHWAAVIYRIDNNNRLTLANRTVSICFMDHNREPIDTVTVEADAYGRVEGTFVVPKDRMNGRFSLMMKDGKYSSSSSVISRADVNVSEYKTPTFAVTFPDDRYSYTIGQPVKVSGKVETYSGMPVANTKVRLSLIQKEWSWWWWYCDGNDGTHLMDTTVTTDAQGMFSFSYEPRLFRENKTSYRYSRYRYQVVATATTDAGETQEASTIFIVGTRRGLELGRENGDIYLNDKPIKLPLIYNTTDEEHPTAMCTWEIIPEGAKEPVKTGNFNTGDPTIDLTSLPSGKYTLKIHILDAQEGEQDVDVERDIILYRKTDREAPVKDCPLWIAPMDKSVDKNNTGHINVGVSTPKAYIYYVASTATKVLAEGWLNYNKGMNDFTVPLPKEPGVDVTVSFLSYYGNKLWENEVVLTNPYKPEALNISATSFRDKLTPGDIEHWTFTLTDQNGKPMRGAMLLDMYDKALASIAQNNWYFPTWRITGNCANLNAVNPAGSSSTNNSWTDKMLNIPESAIPQLPELYTYGQGIFSRYMHSVVGYGATRGDHYLDEARAVRKSAARPMDAARPMEAANTADDILLGVAVTEEAAQPQVNEKNLEKVQLRESDIKTALWQPLLTSDNKGVISLEFEAPNFNTTWITQAVAWNDKMVGSTWMAEVLTQKPLMVRANMPRFLRQGDQARLAATVQNATDQAAACDAVIELFDPRTGDIYATRNFNLQLDPMGSQAVTIDWQVPDTIAMAGFRIKAANGRFGDGEQVMVPVLTTISPVIETEPFYIEAAQGHYETPLPQFPKDARVTLEYCDNPVWYCVLALPTIYSDNYFITTHLIHSLFALQVAQGVAKDQPQIKEAVTYWKQHNEDSTLVSMLQKNQDLKIGTLLASPWMRDAERQTLRMSKLNELFDEAIANREYEKIISGLQTLQMSDGGFTWFLHPYCKSSLSITGTVLEFIGELKHLGYLPEDSRLNTMVERALAYYDSESVAYFNYIKEHYKDNPNSHFTSYAYTRSMYPEVSHKYKSSASLLKNTIKYMDKNWGKGLTLSEKAYYAMTLNRNGHPKTAKRIIESIRQFAIVKPSTGMYWDNLQNRYSWWDYDKVAYTSTILRAMNEIDPRQEEIDQIRKWMLLMKQSNDWGSYSLAADAVYSILSTGSQWLERASLPTITVAGEPVNLDKMAEWLGYFRTTLPATTTGNVVIDRTASGPAWGAVYSQFKAPMTQIQERAIEEVSISKEYYAYAQDGTLHAATSFKVGDKVKVRVIIKTNKDMDFVTMTDERAACFEPVDQLSGYRSEDRTWFYQETKDTQTNVFINSLDKGTHIIGYDVWVTNPGEFTSGIATIQCQYAPQLSAHSAGKTITVDLKE